MTTQHHPGRRSGQAAECGVEIVTAAAELARSLKSDAPAGQHVSPDMVRAVYLFFRALLPEASRSAVDALAELTTLELLRRRFVAPDDGRAPEEDALQGKGAARILDLYGAAEGPACDDLAPEVQSRKH